VAPFQKQKSKQEDAPDTKIRSDPAVWSAPIGELSAHSSENSLCKETIAAALSGLGNMFSLASK